MRSAIAIRGQSAQSWRGVVSRPPQEGITNAVASLLVTCPACGFKTLTTHAACIHCGAALSGLASPQPQPEPQAPPPPSPPPTEKPPEHRDPEQQISPPSGRRRLTAPAKSGREDTVWPPKPRSPIPERPVMRPPEHHLNAKGVALSPHRRGRCPRGHGALTPATLGEETVGFCQSCRGIWMTHHVYSQFLRRQAQHVLEAGAPRAAQTEAPPMTTGSTRPAPCPTCGQPMRRTVHGDVTAVAIEVCGEHGVWVDDQEMKAIMRFIALAGPEFARKLVGG